MDVPDVDILDRIERLAKEAGGNIGGPVKRRIIGILCALGSEGPATGSLWYGSSPEAALTWEDIHALRKEELSKGPR